ncbi:MAG: polysaccharide deacetylase family protein [Alphaproteobacteria bacterium]
MSSWQALRGELDAWQAAGRRCHFWWRDDDAVEPTPALARLLASAKAYRVPLALAVVPLPAHDSLAEALDDAVTTPVQHGLAHVNHAAADAKSAELGPARPLARNVSDLARGWQRMQELFGARAFPLLVPPWNRIDPALIPYLTGLGFRGLSTYGVRTRALAASGLMQVNTHLDIIDWRGGGNFVGEKKALGQLVSHLSARRTGEADADEPSGLLTHHLAHDDAAWRFIDELLALSSGHRAVRWLAVREIVGPAGAEMAASAHDGSAAGGS